LRYLELSIFKSGRDLAAGQNVNLFIKTLQAAEKKVLRCHSLKPRDKILHKLGTRIPTSDPKSLAMELCRGFLGLRHEHVAYYIFSIRKQQGV